MDLPGDAQRCALCRHFRGDPAWLAQALPGITSLSSVNAAVLAQDGICVRHERLCSANASCGEFEPLRASAGGSP